VGAEFLPADWQTWWIVAFRKSANGPKKVYKFHTITNDGSTMSIVSRLSTYFVCSFKLRNIEFILVTLLRNVRSGPWRLHEFIIVPWLFDTHSSSFQNPPPSRKRKNLWIINSLPRKRRFIYLFIYAVESLYWNLFLFFLKLLEHGAMWLEDLFSLSNNFDSSIHWRVRVYCILILGANLRIGENTKYEPMKSERWVYTGSKRGAKEYAGAQSLLFNYLKNRKM
jgi:hypothetical protein